MSRKKREKLSRKLEYYCCKKNVNISFFKLAFLSFGIAFFVIRYIFFKRDASSSHYSLYLVNLFMKHDLKEILVKTYTTNYKITIALVLLSGLFILVLRPYVLDRKISKIRRKIIFCEDREKQYRENLGRASRSEKEKYNENSERKNKKKSETKNKKKEETREYSESETNSTPRENIYEAWYYREYQGNNRFINTYVGEMSTDAYDDWFDYMHHPDNNCDAIYYGRMNYTIEELNDKMFRHDVLLQWRYDNGLCPWKQLVRNRNFSLANLTNEKDTLCYCSYEPGYYDYTDDTYDKVYRNLIDKNNQKVEPNALLGNEYGVFVYDSYSSYFKRFPRHDLIEYMYARNRAYAVFEIRLKNKIDKIDDPYWVLGVDKNATSSEIKTAYRTLLKKYHPDQLQKNGDALYEEACKNAYLSIQDAYQKIS